MIATQLSNKGQFSASNTFKYLVLPFSKLGKISQKTFESIKQNARTHIMHISFKDYQTNIECFITQTFKNVCIAHVYLVKMSLKYDVTYIYLLSPLIKMS